MKVVVNFHRPTGHLTGESPFVVELPNDLDPQEFHRRTLEGVRDNLIALCEEYARTGKSPASICGWDGDHQFQDWLNTPPDSGNGS